ncbi:MAG: SOUL family heme-binding protein [Woeseiaceae bacterium]
MAIEEPEYEVIESFEDFEVRRYAPYLVAEVDVDGEFSEAGNDAFRILAGYIFGDNESATKMAMTAPVEARQSESGEKMAMTAPVTATSADDSNQTTFAFVMERKYTLATLPVPNDDRVRIRQMPERIMAVRRYSGRWTEKNYNLHETTLRSALDSAGIAFSGEPILARYNSPFSLPIMRRNEVMIEVTLTDANQG